MSETRKNIETLNKYVDRLKAVQKQLEGLEKGTDAYNKKLREKNRLEQQSAQANRKLNDSKSKLQSQLPKHRKLINESAQAQKRYSEATVKSTKSNRGFFGSLGRTIKTLGRLAIGYKLIQGASALLSEIFVKSAQRAIKFEKAMADLRAVAALTKEELSSLEAVVFDVAGSTSFTAIQIAELQKQLGKLGSDAEEIAQLTRPVALLSQALGEEPGGVAEALKKALNQFQQTAAEADRFSNVIVGAVNESALTLTDLGTALQYVGPIASQVGLTFDETATFLGLLTNNGLKASRAGTGLRRVLSEAAEEGIPFKDFIEQLAKNNLDAAESFEIFGQRGAGAAIILAETFHEFNALNEEIKDGTRLLKANAVQMSSTEGQLDLLSSAYNKASISIGDYITQTEFFIELIERLDPRVAGQARAFKFLSNATEGGQKAFDDLTTSLIQFNTTQEEQEAGSEALFTILREGTDLSDKQIDRLEKRFNILKKEEPQLRLSEFLQRRVNESVKDAGGFLEQVIGLSAERAKALRQQRIEELATNDQYRAAVELTQKLTSSAKEGVMTDEENLRVTKGLESELKRLQNTRENQKGLTVEEIIVLEKRIALFEELLTSVRNLENSEAAIEKNKQDRLKSEKSRLKDQLKDAIDAIKEQEKLIKEGLSENISDEQFLLQVDLLTALFGDAESIIAEAVRIFGADSEFVANLKKIFGDAAQQVTVAFPKAVEEAPAELAKTFKEKFLEQFKDLNISEVVKEAAETAAKIIDDFADARQDQFQREQAARIDFVRRNGQIENDILKSQLDNQLITESQFRTKQLELQRAQIAKENSINKKIFESKKKQERVDAATDLAVALASIIPNMFIRNEAGEPITTVLKAAISSSLATAAFAAEIAAINSRQFVPKQFAEGGMVNGPSHAQGGVPFSVQGQGGYEMEGGEFIVNKRATAMHRGLLEKINDSYKTRPMSGKHMFATGGLVVSQADKSVDFLKAIAEATTSTAIQTSKPMRAFVSSKDLRNNETERRLRDRNDRI
jgi:hypothetical protein